MKRTWVVVVLAILVGLLAGCRSVITEPENGLPQIPDYEVVVEALAGEEEINMAIQSLADLGGGTLTLSEGTFIIAGPINLISNMILEGQGENTIIKLKDGFNLDINIIHGDGVQNITIRNLVIDGNKANQTDGIQHGIYLKNSNSVTVENVTVKNCRNYGIYLDSSSDSTITGNTCQGNIAHGISLSFNSDNNTITGNTCQGNIGHGISLDSSSNNTITGNTCQGNIGYGIYSYSSSDNTITGNTCQGNGYHGISLSFNSDNNTITGNTCQGNTGGISLSFNSDNNTITGNTCQGNSYHGISLSSSSNNTIADNISHTNSQTANNAYDNIYISDNSDYNNIQSNTCRKGTAANKPRYGIRINTADCDGNIVTNNDLYDSGVSGSFSDAGTGTITTARNRL